MRFTEVGAWLEKQNVRFIRRSQPSARTPDLEVLLVDTLGELLDFYAMGDVAFVGGSLVTVGGHNLLEPAALGVPVLAGPHNFNSADIAKILVDSGAAQIVKDSDRARRARSRASLQSRRTRADRRAGARRGRRKPRRARKAPGPDRSRCCVSRREKSLVLRLCGVGTGTGASGAVGRRRHRSPSAGEFSSSSVALSRLPAACRRLITVSR